MKKKVIGLFIAAILVILGITIFKVISDNREPQWSDVEDKATYEDLSFVDLQYNEDMEYSGKDDPIYVRKCFSYSLDFEENTIEKCVEYDSRYYDDTEESYDVSEEKMQELGEYILKYNKSLYSKSYDYKYEPMCEYSTTLSLFKYTCGLNDKHNRTTEYETYGEEEFGYPEGWYDLIAEIESVIE